MLELAGPSSGAVRRCQTNVPTGSRANAEYLSCGMDVHPLVSVERRTTTYPRTAGPSRSLSVNEAGEVGRYVCMADALGSLASSNFHISEGDGHREDQERADAETTRQKFLFRRSARKSVFLLLGLGYSPRNSLHGPSPVDVYSKTTDGACCAIYTACVVGVGMLALPGAMVRCGVIPGGIALSAMSLAHHFLSQRMLEVPSLVERNLDSLSAMLRAVTSRGWARTMLAAAMFSWYTGCVMIERTMLDHLTKITNLRNVHLQELMAAPECAMACGNLLDERFWWLKPVFAISMIPFAFRVKMKVVERGSKISLVAMMLIMLVDWAAAITYSLLGMKGPEDVLPMYGDDFYSGLHGIMLCYIGLARLPYIAGEMLHPQHAKEVIARASRYSTLLYFVMALVGGWGWGSRLSVYELSPIMLAAVQMREVERPLASAFFYVLACVWLLALFVKMLATFPLFLWPLLREVDILFALDRTPACEIRLPWAMAKVRRKKALVRVALCLSTSLPLYFSASAWSTFKAILLGLGVTGVNFVVPSIIAFMAILAHRDMLKFREVRQAAAIEPSTPGRRREQKSAKRLYFAGDYRVHAATTGAVMAALLILFCLMMVMRAKVAARLVREPDS